MKDQRTTRSGGGATLAIASLVIVAILAAGLLWLGGYFDKKVASGETLTVYCASGVMPAVEKVADQYEREYDVAIELRPGSSGVLEQQIRQQKEGDLYIPAGRDPFLDRTREAGIVQEIIPLANFRLVLAVKPDSETKVASLDDLLREGVDVGVANEEAAVGKATRNALADWPGLEKLLAKATMKPTVTDVANDVQVGVQIDAGLVWDSTARQFGLEIVEVPELSGNEVASSTISAGVLTASKLPTEAIRFARYLAAPEKGQRVFAEFHYEPVEGDPWAVEPEITLYSGTVNRVAIQDTIDEFSDREGCVVKTSYNGCGSLVATMKAGQFPDAYFACDVSYVEQVTDEFEPATNISGTDMVILVKPGNPKNIQTLDDLANEGVAVGLGHPKLSALGALTKSLLEDAGIYQRVLANRVVETNVSDVLVTELTQSDKLDAVIVYRVTCNFVGDGGEIVEIEHASAYAVQPFAIHQQTRYPQLTGRLLEAIASSRSRGRFESTGFDWKASSKSEAEGE